MQLDIKFPKKITRKTHHEWTQHNEIEFILFDLPVQCVISKMNFSSALEGYLRGLKFRTKDYGAGKEINKEELIFIINEVIRNTPRVWNIGEKKNGVYSNTWGIHYPTKQIVEYTSY